METGEAKVVIGAIDRDMLILVFVEGIHEGFEVFLATDSAQIFGGEVGVHARAIPVQRLLEGAGPWTAQGAFAALFALLHWGNPGMHGSTRAWATLTIGLSAILLGLCYLRTRSLALPIGLHLGWNWAQGSLLGFGVSGTTDTRGLWTPVFRDRPEWLTGGAFGLEASLPCALVCGLAIWVVWRWKGPGPLTGASSVPEPE